MKNFICILAAIVALGLSQSPLGAAASRPNIILIMADDMGYGDVSYVNENALLPGGTPHPDQGWVQTPVLDSLAVEGIRFDRFYAASAVCSPTRGSCLTGRNPFRLGIPKANIGRLEWDETPLSTVLSEAGYVSGHFGKWHIGTLTTVRDDARRGDVGNTSVYSAPWHFNYTDCFVNESGVPTYHPYRKPKNSASLPTLDDDSHPTLGYAITDPDFNGIYFWQMPSEGNAAEEGIPSTLAEVNNPVNGDSSKLLVDQAIDFIDVAVGEQSPFLAVLWFATPHVAVVDPAGVESINTSIPLREAVEDMDEAIGTLIDRLKFHGVYDDTMIWFTSDNGANNSSVDSPNASVNSRSVRTGGLREGKTSLYEGGIRVPSILTWPNGITNTGRSTDFLSSTSDYYTTILDYLGLSVPSQKALDGISLRPVIEDRSGLRSSPIGFQLSNQPITRVWMNQDHKLVGARDGSWELYDMSLPDHELELSTLATSSNFTSKTQQIQDIYNQMLAEYTAWEAAVATDSVYVDSTTPSVLLNAVSETENDFELTITFSEAVEGLAADDFVISGGTVGAVSGSGFSYTAEIMPSYLSDISIRLPQGVAFADDGTPSLPSSELLVDVTNSFGLETIVSFDGGSHTTVDSDEQSPATASNNPDKFDGDGEPFATTLYVRGSSENREARVRSLLKFDLSTLGATSVVSATLHLNGYSLNDSNDVSLQAVAAAEDGLSAPDYRLDTLGATVDGGSVVDGLDADLVRDYTLDVTGIVSAWVDGSLTNHGLVLRLARASENNGVGFQLSGNSAPWLEVTQIPPLVDSMVSFDGGSHATVDSNDLSPATASNNPDKFDGVGEPFATTLYVRGSSLVPEARVRSLLKFDLSALDADPVVSAMLHLNGYSLNDSNDVSLQAVAAAEDGLSAPDYRLDTFGAPVDGGSVIDGLDADLVRDYTLDVTGIVSAWMDGSLTNHGLVLRLARASENNGVGFQLSGNSAPRLEVTQVAIGL